MELREDPQVLLISPAERLVHVVGWASIMMVVVLFGTPRLTILGIIGEYLGRLYMGAKNRPLYIVSEIRRDEP